MSSDNPILNNPYEEPKFEICGGHKSHPIEIKHLDQNIAVRIISQLGEECTKVLGAERQGQDHIPRRAAPIQLRRPILGTNSRTR